MFGFCSAQAAPGHAGDVALEPQPWHVDDAGLNAWAETTLDDFAKGALIGVTMELRKKAMFITRSKARAGNCNNPSPYLMGILRKEQEGNPYARAPGSVSRPAAPVMSGPPLAVQMAASPMHAATPRMPAAPSVTAEHKAPPIWVTSALNVHHSRTALMRAVAAHVPAAALDAISSLPSSFQVACVLTMLLSPNSWMQPEAYMKWFAGQCLIMMPNGIQSVSGSTASSHSAKKLAVVIFGEISGCEWVGIGMATQQLSESKLDVEVVERVAFSNPCPWQGVLDDVSQSLTPKAPYQHAAPAEAAQVLTAKAPMWSAQGVSVLALIVGPQPRPSGTFPGAALPGFHAAGASDLWLFLHGLKVLAAQCPSLMVGHFASMTTGSPEDNDGLTKIFGQPWAMNPSHLRVPQQRFYTRCRPATQWDGNSAPRVLTRTPAADCVHRDIVQLFASQAPFDLELPTLPLIEIAIEKRVDNQALTPAEHQALAHVSETTPVTSELGAAGAQRLLGRRSLAAVFGLEQWTFLDHWAKRMPCAGVINAVTGIPVAKEHPEAADCCCPRWCTSCCELYDCLTRCPSPHLVREIVTRMLRDGLFTDREQWTSHPVQESEVPEHICATPCNGLLG